MREKDELSTKTTLRYKKPAVVFDKLSFKMAGKSNDGSYQPRKFKKERVWTDAEMKYLALVLAEEKKQYAVRLETLALKKSSNNQVFEEISKDFEVTYVCQTSSKKRTNAQAFSTCFLGNPSRKLVHYKTRDESHDTPIVRLIVSSRIYTRRMIPPDG